uniref:Uncharacterized protein n=1 Tax=Toxoplasma gondii (strain ATCC 50861 / VEG) TaxID=432359 RepID=A0A0F7V6Z8_TOXGV|nr:TPA: hypothetical protein BN1205_059820 [Toxoplasma gondii VEG]
MSTPSRRPRVFDPPSRARRAYERHRRELAEFAVSRQQQQPPEPLVKRLTTFQLLKENAKEEDRKEKFRTEFAVGLVVKKRPREEESTVASPPRPLSPHSSSCFPCFSPSSRGPLLRRPSCSVRPGASSSFSPARSADRFSERAREGKHSALKLAEPDLRRKAHHSSLESAVSDECADRERSDLESAKRFSSLAAPAAGSSVSSASSSAVGQSTAFLSDILSAYPDEEEPSCASSVSDP